MNAPPQRPRFALTLEALPDPEGVPADRRLARLLKHALRACRFRCVEVREVMPPAGDDRRPDHAPKASR